MKRVLYLRQIHEKGYEWINASGPIYADAMWAAAAKAARDGKLSTPRRSMVVRPDSTWEQ